VLLFGVWGMHESQAELVPVTGLCYWLTPPIHGGRSQLIDFGLLSTSHMCSWRLHFSHDGRLAVKIVIRIRRTWSRTCLVPHKLFWVHWGTQIKLWGQKCPAVTCSDSFNFGRSGPWMCLHYQWCVWSDRRWTRDANCYECHIQGIWALVEGARSVFRDENLSRI